MSVVHAKLCFFGRCKRCLLASLSGVVVRVVPQKYPHGSCPKRFIVLSHNYQRCHLYIAIPRDRANCIVARRVLSLKGPLDNHIKSRITKADDD
jgi:hypothetical protein